MLIVAGLSLFGATVKHVSEGGKIGILTKPLQSFVSFPFSMVEVLKSDELQGIPPTFTELDSSFIQQNSLDYNLYGLNAFYNPDEAQWIIRLFNLKSDTTKHEWVLDKENFVKRKRQFPNSDPRNCILLPNRELIAGHDESHNLFRLNKDSKIIWRFSDTSIRFHHSLNLDVEGQLWVCSSQQAKPFNYIDNYITRVNVENGKLLFHKSVSEILVENGYYNILHGASNTVRPRGNDPLHLNDIEPVLEDGPYWQKGDLLLSLRHRSIILLYRPSTNKVLQILNGPFSNQHDVDIISDHQISFLNNNTSSLNTKLIQEKPSHVLIYNFKDSTFTTPYRDQFIKESIFTRTQGFHQFFSNGDLYVESQKNGKMYILTPHGPALKKYFPTSFPNKIERPHWMRLYEDIDF